MTAQTSDVEEEEDQDKERAIALLKEDHKKEMASFEQKMLGMMTEQMQLLTQSRLQDLNSSQTQNGINVASELSINNNGSPIAGQQANTSNAYFGGQDTSFPAPVQQPNTSTAYFGGQDTSFSAPLQQPNTSSVNLASQRTNLSPLLPPIDQHSGQPNSMSQNVITNLASQRINLSPLLPPINQHNRQQNNIPQNVTPTVVTTAELSQRERANVSTDTCRQLQQQFPRLCVQNPVYNINASMPRQPTGVRQYSGRNQLREDQFRQQIQEHNDMQLHENYSKLIARSIPFFDGKGKKEDADLELKRFIAALNLSWKTASNSISKNEMLFTQIIVTSKVSGRVFDRVDHEELVTIKQLIEVLRSEYSLRFTVTELTAELQDAEQTEDEDVTMFANRLRRIYNQINQQIKTNFGTMTTEALLYEKEALVSQRFKRGLRDPELRQAMTASKDFDLSVMEAHCVGIERLIKSGKQKKIVQVVRRQLVNMSNLK